MVSKERERERMKSGRCPPILLFFIWFIEREREREREREKRRYKQERVCWYTFLLFVFSSLLSVGDICYEFLQSLSLAPSLFFTLQLSPSLCSLPIQSQNMYNTNTPFHRPSLSCFFYNSLPLSLSLSLSLSSLFLTTPHMQKKKSTNIYLHFHVSAFNDSVLGSVIVLFATAFSNNTRRASSASSLSRNFFLIESFLRLSRNFFVK